MMEVVYHPKVPSEVRLILKYYEQVSPKLANEFWDELTGTIELVRSFPKHHHFDQSGRRRVNLKRFPYHFLFRILEGRIRITAVRHHSRDPGYGSRRK